MLEQQPARIDAAPDCHKAVQEAKQQIAAAALRKARGHYAEAARQLGLHPRRLDVKGGDKK